MKKLLIFALALLLAPAFAFAAPAEYTDALYFYSSHTGEADGPAATFLSYGGAKPMSGTQACITFANVTSDLATARLFALVETGDETTVDVAVAAANTTVPVAATTDLTITSDGSWVMLYDPSTGYAEVDRISSGTAATNIVLVGTTDHAYTTATRVIELTTSGASNLVANTTVTFTGAEGVLCGKMGQALGWYLDGTSACRIGNIVGTYKR
jgi:VCBS repeat-containing protein